MDPLVVIRGGGDLGSGAAYRLHRSGFRVLICELDSPRVLRRPVAFAEAVYSGAAQVEGVSAHKATNLAEALVITQQGAIGVLVDPGANCLDSLAPEALVDARMLKRSPGWLPVPVPFVVGLGPGFVAGGNCHAVIETNRGHNLGRVIWQGGAEPDTGRPGSVGGHDRQRIVRAPHAGRFEPEAEIGDLVNEGQRLGTVDGHLVLAPLTGVLRGLVHRGLEVTAGLKIGDIDPRARHEYCFTISEKALAIGGGVLEAVLYARRQPHWAPLATTLPTQLGTD